MGVLLSIADEILSGRCGNNAEDEKTGVLVVVGSLTLCVSAIDTCGE